MKKEEKDIKKEVLKKIDLGEVKMKSKAHFEVLKVLWAMLMTASVLVAIFLINLAFYLPKRAGVFQGLRPGRLNVMLSSIPWWLVLFGAIFIGIAVYIYRNYEGGYKKHLSVIIIAIAVLVITIGGVLAVTNINEGIEKRPGMRQFYQWNEKRFGPPGMRSPMHRDRLNQKPGTFKGF